MNTNDYLYLVLIPVAEVFRSRFQKGSAPFNAIKNNRTCRVKFISKRLDKEWQEFCKNNELKNDPELEY